MNAWAWRSRDQAISRYVSNLLWTIPAWEPDHDWKYILDFGKRKLHNIWFVCIPYHVHILYQLQHTLHPDSNGIGDDDGGDNEYDEDEEEEDNDQM